MTDCCDDRAFLEQIIALKKAALLGYYAATTALAGGAQSYSLDTGQTRQVVTKANLSEMRIMITTLEGEIFTFQQRLNACGTFQVRPGW